MIKSLSKSKEFTQENRHIYMSYIVYTVYDSDSEVGVGVDSNLCQGFH